MLKHDELRGAAVLHVGRHRRGVGEEWAQATYGRVMRLAARALTRRRPLRLIAGSYRRLRRSCARSVSSNRSPLVPARSFASRMSQAPCASTLGRSHRSTSRRRSTVTTPTSCGTSRSGVRKDGAVVLQQTTRRRHARRRRALSLSVPDDASVQIGNVAGAVELAGVPVTSTSRRKPVRSTVAVGTVTGTRTIDLHATTGRRHARHRARQYARSSATSTVGAFAATFPAVSQRAKISSVHAGAERSVRGVRASASRRRPARSRCDSAPMNLTARAFFARVATSLSPIGSRVCAGTQRRRSPTPSCRHGGVAPERRKYFRTTFSTS